MNQRGIALIQVLILTVVLTVILLSMNHQAKQHIRLAQAVKQYTNASLELHSVEAETLFNLLTKQSAQGTQSAAGGQWNFYGQPFAVGDATIRIQDTSGLVNAVSPSEKLMSRFTEQEAGNTVLGRQFAAALADWQDTDQTTRPDGAEQAEYSPGMIRNSSIQYLEEWLFVKGMTPELFYKIRPLLTLFSQGLNINQQPEELWKLSFDQRVANELIQARLAGKLDSALFESLTGITIDEFTRFNTGPGFRINFTVKKDDVRLARELTVKLLPLQKNPIELYEYRFRDLPTDLTHADNKD